MLIHKEICKNKDFFLLVVFGKTANQMRQGEDEKKNQTYGGRYFTTANLFKDTIICLHQMKILFKNIV